MDVLRAFIAIDIPLWVKTEILKIQTRLRGMNLKASWVRQENFHITLEFLGNIDPHVAPRIVNKMNEFFSTRPKFSLSLGGLGVFPDQNDPRVIWVAIQDPGFNLERLKEISKDAMSGLSSPIETREYVPHITLGYIKSLEGIEKMQKILHTAPSTKSSTFEVTSVKLFKSQLTSEGSVYTKLANIHLNG